MDVITELSGKFSLIKQWMEGGNHHNHLISCERSPCSGNNVESSFTQDAFKKQPIISQN